MPSTAPPTSVSSSASSGLQLLVSGGDDLGSRRVVSSNPMVVGRGRSADWRLSDPTISRSHLSVWKSGDGVAFSVNEGAADVLLDGRPVREASLVAGDRIVVGATALSVVRMTESVPLSDHGSIEVTDVRTLVEPQGAGAEKLASIFHLTELVDGMNEESVLEDALQTWLQKHLGSSTGACFRSLDPSDGSNDALVERNRPEEGRVIVVPLTGLPSEVFEVTLPEAGRPLGDDDRRWLVVASKVVASALQRIRAIERVAHENRDLRRVAYGSARSYLGQSTAAEGVSRLLERLAASATVALITGETGVGKSFFARLIHETGPRATEPSRVVNCAAIPEHLVEAELFGHAKGAFTGASTSRAGAFASAGKGTILLDEIGDLSLNSQAKLLHVLEARCFEPLGSDSSVPLEARILTATNRDLEQMVEDGTFRRDLYYRISVVTVRVPSLRERVADIPMLAQRFLDDLAPSCGRRVTGFSDATFAALSAHPWPGNVRELRNVIEHALVLGDAEIIEPSDLPFEVRADDSVGEAIGQGQGKEQGGDVVRLPMNLAALEDRAIAAALHKTGGNRTKAASLLGINRVTLYKKLRKADASGD